VLVGITEGIQPYGGHSMGWENPLVIGLLAGGLVLLVVFAVVERRVSHPMFELGLFRIRAFTAGNIAGRLGAIARAGPQFILIIWLQGIWLPLRAYNFDDTPLWAGVFILPLTFSFLAAGPISGYLPLPLPLTRLRERGDAPVRAQPRRAAAAARRLPLLGVRGAARAQRDRRRHTRAPRSRSAPSSR
jgi:hypothetical protein